MLWLFSFSYATWALLSSLIVFLLIIVTDTRKSQKQGKAPGPYKLPILGNLLEIAKYPDSSIAFAALAKIYGDVVSLRLGTVDCLLITGMEKIRSILHTKGHLFDSRPDFQRYNMLFNGDKNNSIAFSNWSELQRRRRDLIKNHTFPKQYTSMFEHLDAVAGHHLANLMARLTESGEPTTVYLKPLLTDTIGKIFIEYFTSTEITADNHEDFIRMVDAFDYIFQEVNEGCLGDLIPSVMFLCNKSHLASLGENIRHFVLKHCVEPRYAEREIRPPPPQNNSINNINKQPELKPNRHSMSNMEDFHHPTNNNGSDKETESLSSSGGGGGGGGGGSRMPHRHSEPNFAKIDLNNNDMDGSQQNDLLDTFLNNVGKDNITLDIALYGLEDILGGHSAIANMLTRLFVLLGQNPEVQEKIHYEVIESVGKSSPVNLFNRLPYTEATMWEGVRHIASPIVPHVAVADTTIDEFAVPKGTVLFINNREMHFSPSLWTDPEKFDPQRFITSENLVVKPEYFIPFSTGRRSCMGYKLVQHITFLCLANIFQKFSIQLDPTENYAIKGGNLAVKGQGHRFILNPLD